MTHLNESSSYYRQKSDDRAFCDWSRLILNTGIGGVVCCFGLVANFVSYIILNKGRSSGPVATFLLRALSLTDNLFLLAWFLVFSLRDLFRYVGYNSMAWRYIRVYSFPILFIGQSATVWMTVIIALTRYAAVCMPYAAKRICTMFNVQISVGALYFFVILYNLPRFFDMYIDDRNGTIWIDYTKLGMDKTYQFVYMEVLYIIFSFALPLLLLIVLNSRLTAAYRAVEKRRQRLRGATSQGQQDDTNITLVMIVVVAVFVICQGPGRLAQIIWKYQYGSCKTVAFFIMEISTILEVLNSSVNFLIYFVIRAQFRTHLLAVFCRRRLASSDSTGLTSNSTGLAGQTADKTDMTSCSITEATKVKDKDLKDESQTPFLQNNAVPESNV